MPFSDRAPSLFAAKSHVLLSAIDFTPSLERLSKPSVPFLKILYPSKSLLSYFNGGEAMKQKLPSRRMMMMPTWRFLAKRYHLLHLLIEVRY